MKEKIVICGANGYVGSRFTNYLRSRGYSNLVTVAQSLKTEDPALMIGDLREAEFCHAAVKDAFAVFNFAASVGGISYVQKNNATALENVLINTNLVRACASAGVGRYFFASSSCVYPDGIERPLKESDAYPASPMGGYGWEKLFSEQTCLAFAAERNLPMTILRYHGIYGPNDIRPAGRDHVIAAMVKKVIFAKWFGVPEVAIWGDGSQTRSFLYIDDCIEGTYRAAFGKGVTGPLNLAHPEPASVNDIVDALEDIAGIQLARFYNDAAHKGRHSKTSDNSQLRRALNWEPEIPLKDGLRICFHSAWEKALQQKL